MRPGSFTVELYIRARMLATSLRRLNFRPVALGIRHKLLLALALVVLVCWFNLGSLRSSSKLTSSSSVEETIERFKQEKLDREKSGLDQDPTVPKALKAKEYPDFDYRYDLKLRKKGGVWEMEGGVGPNNEALDKAGFRNDSPSKASSSSKKQRKSSQKHRSQKAKPLYPPSDDVYQLPEEKFQKPPKLDQERLNRNSTNNRYNVHQSRRSQNLLNGVQLPSNHGDFDVVGGADLFGGISRGGELARDELEFAGEFADLEEGAGDGGDPVQLDEEETVRGEEVMKKEAFNLVASDKMSLHRIVPDTRDPACQRKTYDDPSSLPTASVVIIFTNEAWTPLLRTVWSVLEKTPEESLHEIILVDDFSDKKYLKGKLERYITKKFPSKVRLVRLPRRSGLIRARLTGARLATGDVLLFLDSHCECGYDWIQPLLQRIKDEPRAFVVPIIDVIDDKTMEYYHGNGAYFQIGGFTWDGHFNWIDVPDHEDRRRGGDSTAPVRSPTMAGGLFAVGRDTFWEMGSYDEEMDVWGGENLEMSFRVWQCGGMLETVPCSRVGHIFRSFHPYTFPGNKDTHGINTARTVEVWMDDYKRLFYMNRPDLLSIDIGDVSKRLAFKRDKSCHSFKWYLDNVFPQKFVMDDPEHAAAHGRVRNQHTSLCLDTLQADEKGKESYRLGAYPCHDFQSATQYFSYSKKSELRREDTCAEVSSFSSSMTAPGGSDGLEPVQMAPCHGSRDGNRGQEWSHTREGRLIHKETNKCLQAFAGGGDQQSLFVAPCRKSQSQLWYFDDYLS